MTAGHSIGCFGLTEPDSGSDPGSMRTGLDATERTGYCTDKRRGSQTAALPTLPSSGLAPTMASVDSSSRRAPPGFTTQDIHKKLSLRAIITSELLLDDVRLPADAVLPEATSLKGPLSCLNGARYGIVWGAAGAARACLEAALEYAGGRVQFDQPIAAFQIQQHKFAHMALEVNRATLLALHPATSRGKSDCV
jgi:glutaryl-CoA dehydrogenase